MAGKRTLVIDFIVDDKDARAALGRVDNSLDSTGKNFGTMATGVKAALTGVAAKAVFDFSKEMFELGVRSDQIKTRFATVFGDMADAARQWADDSNESFGVGLVNLQGMMSQVQDLLVPLGFARDEASGMTQTILETADALALWAGKDLQDVTDTIIAALTGERERLKSLGIVIKEADIQAALDAKGLGDLTGEARNTAAALVTLELITARSEDALTAYRENGIDPAVAAQRELNATFEDTKTTIAEAFYPAIGGAIKITNELAQAFFGAGDALSGLLDKMNVFNAIKNQPGIAAGRDIFFPGSVPLGEEPRNIGGTVRERPQGDVNIQNVNITGVLDPTDPASSRKVVRELATAIRKQGLETQR